jgi:hypothetical protein
VIGDPVEREGRRGYVERMCRERGSTITRKGIAYRLTGAGIDLVVADLAIVTENELVGHRLRDGSIKRR